MKFLYSLAFLVGVAIFMPQQGQALKIAIHNDVSTTFAKKIDKMWAVVTYTYIGKKGPVQGGPSKDLLPDQPKKDVAASGRFDLPMNAKDFNISSIQIWVQYKTPDERYCKVDYKFVPEKAVKKPYYPPGYAFSLRDFIDSACPA